MLTSPWPRLDEQPVDTRAGDLEPLGDLGLGQAFHVIEPRHSDLCLGVSPASGLIRASGGAALQQMFRCLYIRSPIQDRAPQRQMADDQGILADAVRQAKVTREVAIAPGALSGVVEIAGPPHARRAGRGRRRPQHLSRRGRARACGLRDWALARRTVSVRRADAAQASGGPFAPAGRAAPLWRHRDRGRIWRHQRCRQIRRCARGRALCLRTDRRVDRRLRRLGCGAARPRLQANAALRASCRDRGRCRRARGRPAGDGLVGLRRPRPEIGRRRRLAAGRCPRRGGDRAATLRPGAGSPGGMAGRAGPRGGGRRRGDPGARRRPADLRASPCRHTAIRGRRAAASTSFRISGRWKASRWPARRRHTEHASALVPSPCWPSTSSSSRRKCRRRSARPLLLDHRLLNNSGKSRLRFRPGPVRDSALDEMRAKWSDPDRLTRRLSLFADVGTSCAGGSGATCLLP